MCDGIAATVSVYLQGTNEFVLSFHLSDSNMTLSSVRPFILQQLNATSPDTKIAFVSNEALIPFDSVRVPLQLDSLGIVRSCR